MIELSFVIRIAVFVVLAVASRYLMRLVAGNLTTESQISRFQSIVTGKGIAVIFNLILFVILIAAIVIYFFAPHLQLLAAGLLFAYFLLSIGRIVYLYFVLNVFIPQIASLFYALATLLQLIGLAVLILPFWLNPLLALIK